MRPMRTCARHYYRAIQVSRLRAYGLLMKSRAAATRHLLFAHFRDFRATAQGRACFRRAFPHLPVPLKEPSFLFLRARASPFH